MRNRPDIIEQSGNGGQTQNDIEKTSDYNRWTYRATLLRCRHGPSPQIHAPDEAFTR
jgi:hypothetical protein